MCGFVGIVHVNKKEVAYRQQIETMNQTIAHRGPNSEGYYQNETIHFGFRRLSILDLECGSQPMSFADERYWIVFNGEIYNHQEQRAALEKEGVRFATSSDTEVILALYDKYKEKTASMLRGMFAFLIWDNQEGTVYGARDQFGMKPMYVSQIEGDYYFASENKAIETIMPNKTVNKAGLQHYFTFQYVPGEKRLVEGIESINPGTYFTIDKDNKMSLTRYYQPTFQPVEMEELALAKEISDVLHDSVKAHMRADVTVGSFLSGGVDSSIIVALARQLSPNLKTFSVGFEREGFNEIEVAQETAAKLDVENFSRIITPEDFINEFDGYIWSLDDPLADPAAVAQYFLAQVAGEHCTVSLSGEGADELFGGYPIYHEPLSLAAFEKIPRGINKVIHSVAKTLPRNMKGRGFLLRGSTPLEERFVGNAKIFTEEEKQPFLKTFNSNQHYMQVTDPYYRRSVGLDPTTRMQDLDMHTWLVDDLLHNADRTTMASSIELRAPFVDKEVFRVAAKIPTSLKFKNNTTKYLLRKAAEGFVPEHVLYREKLGFPVPIRFWLQNELYDWARTIIQEAKTDEFIDKAYVLKMLENHRKGDEDFSRKLWTFITFIRWYEIHVLMGN